MFCCCFFIFFFNIAFSAYQSVNCGHGTVAATFEIIPPLSQRLACLAFHRPYERSEFRDQNAAPAVFVINVFNLSF